MNNTPVTVPPPSERKILPIEVEANILRLLTTYLLYERGEQTQLRLAFMSLVEERHNYFHVDDSTEEDKRVKWLDCKNRVCINSRLILESERKQEVFLNPLAIQLMEQYGVMYSPAQGAIQAKLVAKSAIVQPENKILTPS